MCGILNVGLGVLALSVGIGILVTIGLIAWMLFAEDEYNG